MDDVKKCNGCPFLTQYTILHNGKVQHTYACYRFSELNNLIAYTVMRRYSIDIIKVSRYRCTFCENQTNNIDAAREAVLKMYRNGCVSAKNNLLLNKYNKGE